MECRIFIAMLNDIECRFSEYHNAECRYAECRGVIIPFLLLLMVNLHWRSFLQKPPATALE